jgi:subtilisin family serine protease
LQLGFEQRPGAGSAVNAAIAQGMVICVAAGNDNATTQSYLASRGDCFDVGATSNDDTRAGFSNFGGWVDVMAPGVGIFSTYFNHTAVGSAQHTYDTLQGTSMATPIVTGLVGLVKAANSGDDRSADQERHQGRLRQHRLAESRGTAASWDPDASTRCAPSGTTGSRFRAST